MSFKYSEWEWKIFDAFSLNISFTHFNLKYSGEACLQERIIINSRQNITIVRFCGRRYHFSVFVKLTPMVLTFHTYQSSRSQFELQYELTDVDLTSYTLNYKNYSEFSVIEKKSFLFPFAWINKYCIQKDIFYNWNIFVPKMYKLILKLKKYPQKKNILYLYDGPDYHSDQYDLNSMTSFVSTSFQVAILLQAHFSDVDMELTKYLFKETVQNYKVYTVKNRLEIISSDLKCIKESVNLCAFNFIVHKNFFVNITFSFKYLGPNVGYCKYGGLSVYDYVNSIKKEVFLSCDNWFFLPLSSEPNRTIISSTESLFLVFYSYHPQSEIEVQLKIESSSCQGVNVER